MWAYAIKDESYEGEKESIYIGLDLDHLGLMNNSEDDPNIFDGQTIRDIKKGEEFLVSYRSFEKEGLWEKLGLGPCVRDV